MEIAVNTNTPMTNTAESSHSAAEGEPSHSEQLFQRGAKRKHLFVCLFIYLFILEGEVGGGGGDLKLSIQVRHTSSMPKLWCVFLDGRWSGV